MPTNNGWKVFIENCDADFIWQGEGPVLKSFMKQIKMAACGDNYREKDERSSSLCSAVSIRRNAAIDEKNLQNCDDKLCCSG